MSIPQKNPHEEKSLASPFFEDPTESARVLREVIGLCQHFQGRELLVCTSDTQTLDEARTYAASMINPEGTPELWLVHCKTDPSKTDPYDIDGHMTDWRTLAVAGNGPHGEHTARFIAIAATILPEILPSLLELAEREVEASTERQVADKELVEAKGAA